MIDPIKAFCVTLVFIWTVFVMVLTTLVAFSPDHVCRDNAIAPIDYIVPFRIAGCWLGDMPMKTKAERDQAND